MDLLADWAKNPNAAILSSSDGSRSACFQGNARFFVACWLLRMTVQLGFSAACWSSCSKNPPPLHLTLCPAFSASVPTFANSSGRQCGAAASRPSRLHKSLASCQENSRPFPRRQDKFSQFRAETSHRQETDFEARGQGRHYVTKAESWAGELSMDWFYGANAGTCTAEAAALSFSSSVAMGRPRRTASSRYAAS